MTTAPTSTVPAALEPFLAKPKQLLINGQWGPAASGETFEVYNPASAEVIAHCAAGDKADIDHAVKAARAAFEDGPWSKMSGSERGQLIWKIGDLIEQHKEELAQLETLDNGKPYGVALVADVALAADMFRYMAGWVTKIKGDTFPITVPYAPDADFHAFTLKEPVGVVGQIIPWNFPLLMAAWKLGPALAAGCTVILKPAEQTPLSAIRLGELMLEAGLPDGVVNIVTGLGETAGAAIAAHDGIDKVAFTGSTEVGKLILQAAAGNLKKVTLELGGKSPNVVYKDANLDTAIAGAASAIFFNQGQVCSAGSRLFIEQDIFDDVVSGVSEIAKNMKVGSGFDEGTEMGPLVSKEQHDRVKRYLDAGLTGGATATAGGAAVDRPGYFVQPTVLSHVTDDMQVVKEEIFGPVVTAMPFKNDREIAQRANDTDYGLAAGVWTSDISKAHKLAKSIRAGTVWVNCYNIFDAALPFGGYKQSGWGREMGYAALENYLETKSVCIGLQPLTDRKTVADTRLQRDRWVALALAGVLVAWWGLGMAYKRYRAEPYPALSMPGFAGNCGLTGSVYHDHQQRVEIELVDGRVLQAPLVDTLLRCGMKRGEVPTVMAHLVGLEGNKPDTMRISRIDPRLMEMALLGVSPDGPVQAADVAGVRVVLYHRRYDLQERDLVPAVVRLGDWAVAQGSPGGASSLDP